MATQSQAKPRNRKIEPLNWQANASAPALKGLVSFLDIRREDLQHGFKPVDSPSSMVDTSPPDITAPVPRLSPVAAVTPIDVQVPIPIKSPVDVQSPPPTKIPVGIPSTGRSVYRSLQRSRNMVEGEVPTLNRKIIRCRIAQDGHTPAEESVYRVLWDASTPTAHTVRMGYAELAAKTRLSKKTIGRLVLSLLEKLAIEVQEQYHSGDLVPNLYRVFSYKEILDRRRDACMEYVIRTKGVIFVTSTGDPVLQEREGKRRFYQSGDVQDPVDTPKPADELSIGDIQLVSACLNQFWPSDEAAAIQLIRSCRAIRPDAEAHEIVFFSDEKLAISRSSRTITNPTGFVLATVPQCFVGQTFESFRARRAEVLRIQAEEEERKGREAREMNAYFRNRALAVLADSKSTESERREAEKDLQLFPE